MWRMEKMEQSILSIALTCAICVTKATRQTLAMPFLSGMKAHKKFIKKEKKIMVSNLITGNWKLKMSPKILSVAKQLSFGYGPNMDPYIILTTLKYVGKQMWENLYRGKKYPSLLSPWANCGHSNSSLPRTQSLLVLHTKSFGIQRPFSVHWNSSGPQEARKNIKMKVKML